MNKTPQASTSESSQVAFCPVISNRGVPSQRGFVLPSPTMLMAAVIIGLSISNVIFVSLYRSTANEYSDFKTRVASESELLRSENERKLQAVTTVHRQVEHDYAQARAALAAGPRVVRVRDTCSGTGILPGVSANAGIIAQLPVEESGLGSERVITAEECEARINWAAEDAMTIEWMKYHDNQAHEASK